MENINKYRVKNRRRKIYSYVNHKDPLGLNLNFGIKCPGSHIEKGTMVSYKVLIVRKTKNYQFLREGKPFLTLGS